MPARADLHRSRALEETQQLVQELQQQLGKSDMQIARLTFEVCVCVFVCVTL